MAYSAHFTGISATTGGYAIGAKGSEVVVFGGSSATTVTAAFGTSSSPYTTSSTGTSNVVSVYGKLTAVSGIIRGILSQVEFSGTQVATTVNCYAIRGYSKISGTLTSANGYAAGVQGCLEITGTLGSGARSCAMLAQVKASTGSPTLSSGGEIMGLFVDNQLTSKGSSTFRMVAVENTVDGVVADSMFFIYGRATYLFEFGGSQNFVDTTATAGDQCVGHLKVYFNGAAAYLNVYSDNS
jgi:hypothetical protein